VWINKELEKEKRAYGGNLVIQESGKIQTTGKEQRGKYEEQKFKKE